MSETELERIKGLELIAEFHTKNLDDHEKRIDALEEVSSVVSRLNDAVTRQGDNIDKLSQNTNTAIKELVSVINDVKKTTEKLEIMQAEAKVRQQYWFIDGILTIVKKIGIKGFIGIGTAVAAIATALHIWG